MGQLVKRSAISLILSGCLAGMALHAHAGSGARDWIETGSERDGTWRDHGDISFPSGRIFVGDPTWGDAYHLRNARDVTPVQMQLWSFGDGKSGQNYSIWLEAAGTVPVRRGENIEFGVDAATLALGDYGAGQALVDLGEALMDQGKGDSFDWILPHIQTSQTYAKWLPIPPDNQRMFLATTNNDGGYAAVWLYDAQGGLSGILIDLRGRKSDLKFLDVLLQDTQ